MQLQSLLLTIAMIHSASAVEWPEIRGGKQQGFIKAENVPVKIDFEKDVVWKSEIPGKGWSSPVSSGGLIVMTSAVGEEKAVLRVIAVDEKTGDIVWNVKAFEPSEEEASIRHRKNSLASPSPLISDGIVYVHFGHMGTAALMLKDGAVKWRYHETYDAVHGNGGSVVLADGVLIFTADGKDHALTRGIDAKTGAKIWEKDRGVKTSRKFSFATPLVVDMEGEKQVISQGADHIGSYRPKTGEFVWSLSPPAGWSVVPTPILDQGHVYLATGFARPNLIAIKLTGAKGDITESHLKWIYKKDIPATPSFVIQDDVIYLIQDSGKLSAINKKNGERFWVEPLKRNFSASPVLVGDHFYSYTEEGVGYVHKVTREGAEKIAENDFGEPIFATPIVYDGGMVVRSERTLWKLKGN